jgi:hypothetical protein
MSDLAILEERRGDSIVEGDSIEDVVEEAERSEHSGSCVAVQRDGYTERRLFRGDSLADLLRKLREKAGGN